MDRRRKIIHNPYEAATHEALEAVAVKYGARIFPKVRIADALDLRSSGLTSNEYSYALQAHFDFLITDQDTWPHFAVEFDGPRHHTNPSTILRDNLKNAICEKLGIPLLRIGDDFFRRVGRYNLIGWLTEVWFLYEAFNAAQEAGSVPYDEVFHYSLFLGFAYRDGGRLVDIDGLDPAEQLRLLREHEGRIVVTQPYDPFLASRAFINRAFQRSDCREPVPKEIVGIDSQGFHVALAVLNVTENRAVIGTARVRSFRFPPVSPTELAMELSVVDVVEKLKQYRQGSYAALTATEVRVWEHRIVKKAFYP